MTEPTGSPDLAALVASARAALVRKAHAERHAAEHALAAGEALAELLALPGGAEALAAGGVPEAVARPLAALVKAGATVDAVVKAGGTRGALVELQRRLRARADARRAPLEGGEGGDGDAL